MSNTLTGKIIAVLAIETFTNSEKRTFVIETEGKYPDQVPFDLWKDRVSLVTEAHIGQTCTVHFDPKGREHNGKWYCSLNCWKVEISAEPVKTAAEPVKTLPTPTELQFKNSLLKVKSGEVTVETVQGAFNLTSQQILQLQNAVPLGDDLPF